MFDAKKLLDQFMGVAETYAGKENVDKVKSAIASNPGMAKAAGVGLAAVLMGTKSGRKLGGNAIKMGGLAVVGGLAYQAYQNWQRNKGLEAGTQPRELAPPPPDSVFSTAGGSEQDRSKAFLVAMIAAAKADGHIDMAEQKRIFGRMESLVDSDSKAFLMDEMMGPSDLERIAAMATSPEMAMELYTASCLAIDLDHVEERAWLDKLAARLGLDPALTEEIERSVSRERATA